MKQLLTDTPPSPAPPPTVTAAQPVPVIDKAAALATEARVRNPQYPGFEAVRDLYDQYLKLSRQYEDLATQVEQLKHELQVVRGSVTNG